MLIILTLIVNVYELNYFARTQSYAKLESRVLRERDRRISLFLLNCWV